jgi:hypothetical protein
MQKIDNKEIDKRCCEILAPMVIGLTSLIDSDLNKSDTPSFANGSGYIQHSPEVVEKCQKLFLQYCYEVLKQDIFLEEKVHRQGIVGRYLNDCGNNLYTYWHRFLCTDSEYREWGQPFFAINPDKGKKVCFNDLPSVRSKFRDIKLNEII